MLWERKSSFNFGYVAFKVYPENRYCSLKFREEIQAKDTNLWVSIIKTAFNEAGCGHYEVNINREKTGQD